MKMYKLFWGLMVIGLGVLLLFVALGIGNEFSAVSIIGSLLLLAVGIASLAKFRFVLFFIPFALIAYIWRNQLGVPGLSVWPLLGAAVLVGIGLSVLFHKKHVRVNFKKRDEAAKTEAGKTEITLNENEQVDIDASWGEHIRYIHANNLKKVQVKSSFAETRVYFDQAQISPEGLEITVDASFCELVLVVPRSWNIDSHVSIFAGTVTNLAPITGGQTANVVLNGKVNLAELRLEYV
jgi:predicted membrane protein